MLHTICLHDLYETIGCYLITFLYFIEFLTLKLNSCTCSSSSDPFSTAWCSASHLVTNADRWCASGSASASASRRRPCPASTSRSSLLSPPLRAHWRSWAPDTTPTTDKFKSCLYQSITRNTLNRLRN